jgi:hypothetical protein
VIFVDSRCISSIALVLPAAADPFVPIGSEFIAPDGDRHAVID